MQNQQRPPVMRAPVVQRSKLMLEIASELVGSAGWNERQVEVHFREQGASDWRFNFFASDAPNSVEAVASGKADFAVCNPGGVLAMARHGLGPFKQPIPLRAIAVFPQLDRLGFGVAANVPIRSLTQLKEERPKLRVSLREQGDHSTHLMADLVLSTYGYSIADMQAWGATIRYDYGIPSMANGRIDAVERGEVDMVIDESFTGFATKGIGIGMHFLPVDDANLQQLEKIGLRRLAVTSDEFPGLEQDFETLDYSGWPIFCLESTPDTLVTAFCTALEARKDRIPWFGEGPMDLDLMVSDTPEAPMAIPLHSAAQAFWGQQGYV